jgi:hypothetical protein
VGERGGRRCGRPWLEDGAARGGGRSWQWVPPVGERGRERGGGGVRVGREGGMGCEGGGEMGQAGPRRVWAAGKKKKRKEGEKRGFDFFSFSFFNHLNHFSKSFFKSNLLHKFFQIFTNLFHNYF